MYYFSKTANKNDAYQIARMRRLIERHKGSRPFFYSMCYDIAHLKMYYFSKTANNNDAFQIARMRRLIARNTGSMPFFYSM